MEELVIAGRRNGQKRFSGWKKARNSLSGKLIRLFGNIAALPGNITLPPVCTSPSMLIPTWDPISGKQPDIVV